MIRLIFISFTILLFASCNGWQADNAFRSGNDKVNAEDYKGAIDDYSKAIYKKNNRAYYYFNRGYCYYMIQDYANSYVDITKAIEVFPQAKYFYYRGRVNEKLYDFEKAISDYNESIHLNKKYVLAYYRKGLVEFRIKKFNDAVVDFTNVIAIDSQFRFTFYYLATAEKNLKSYSNSISDYQKEIKNHPFNYIAISGLGELYFRIGQLDKALVLFNQASDVQPNWGNALFNRAITKYYLKDYAGALDDFSMCIPLWPTERECYFYRANIKLFQSDTAGAIVDYNIAANYGSIRALTKLKEIGAK